MNHYQAFTQALSAAPTLKDRKVTAGAVEVARRVFRIEVEHHQLAVKVYDPTADQAIEREARGLEELALAAPNWIPRLHETGQLPSGMRYLVRDAVPGVTLQAADGNQAPSPHSLTLIGEVLRRLHHRCNPRFGAVTSPSHTTAADFIDHLVAERWHLFTDRLLADWMLAMADVVRPMLNQTTVAVLCHGDLHAENILVTRRRRRPRIEGIIDYESAIYAFAEYDLAKALVVSSAFNEAHRDALLKGYGTPVNQDLLTEMLTFHTLDGWLWAAEIESRDKDLWSARIEALPVDP